MPALKELIARFDVAFEGQQKLQAGSKAVEGAKVKLDQTAKSADLLGTSLVRLADNFKRLQNVRLPDVKTGFKTSGQGNDGKYGPGDKATTFAEGFGSSLKSSKEVANLQPTAPDPTRWQQFGAALGVVRTRIQALADSPGIFDKLAGSWSKVLAVSAGLFVAQKAVGGLIDESRELLITSKRIGVTVEELKKMREVAYMSSVSSDALTMGVRQLYRQLGQATNGSKTARELFDALGVSYEKTNGRLTPLPEMFQQVVRSMSLIEDPTQRAALAMQVFGRSGLQMMPLLNKSPKELEEIAERIEELGGGIDPEFIERTAKLGKAQKELHVASESFRSRVLVALLPSLTTWAKKSTDVLVALQHLNRGGALTRLMVIGLAAVVATRVPAMAASVLAFGKAWALPIVAMAALGLVAEDVWAAFQGGRSVFGEDFVPAVLTGLNDAEKAVRIFCASFEALFSLAIASVKDQWGGLVQMLRIPEPIANLISSTGNIEKAQQAWSSKQTDIAAGPGRFDEELASVRAYNARMVAGERGANWAEARGGLTPEVAESIAKARAWQAAGGRMGQTVSSFATPGGVGSKTITINDNSKTELTVHGSTADQAKQVAAQAAKLNRIARASANTALLQEVE